MNSNILDKRILVMAGTLLLLLTACKTDKKKELGEQAAATQTYTCPMHPQIIQNKMGTCPICGMDLVAFDKNNKEAFLTLSKEQQALANVTLISVGDGFFNDITRLNGRLAISPEQTKIISSRVVGRIEKLFVKETGAPVTEGQPLYKIYSEALLVLQQEYILAITQAEAFPEDKRFAQIAEGAKQKLSLYDQSPAALRNLRDTKKTSPYILYPSPASGVVAELSVTEGQYLGEGGAIMKLENYDQLWVEADVYPNEAALVKQGQQLRVIIPGFEQEPKAMTVQFIQPALINGSQLLQIRGTIANDNKQWQPGLQALVLLPRTDKKTKLMLPLGAVIRDGETAHVWVATTNEKFEPKEVITGMENADQVEITRGLTAGDKVVATGAYLLYSEYILKKGAHPIAHHH